MIPNNLNTILLAEALTDAANVLLGIFSGATDVLTGFLFPVISLILYPFYLIIIYILGAYHQLLLILVTYTPYPTDSSGNPVIFGTPSTSDPFYSMVQISNNYLEPFAMVIILIGIAIVLFARIFDVAIDSINIAGEAKERLLIAPFLVLLWIPIANLVLVLASGLTDMFSNVTVTFDSSMFTHVSLGGIFKSSGSGPPELDFISLMKSLGPNISGGWITGGENLFSMILAGLFGLVSTTVYAVVIIMALMRVMIVYVLYIVGPISIALWAFAWKQFSELGKDYIKYFILFALFPVPAALINTLLPIMFIAIEESVMTALSGSSITTSGSGSGFSSAVGGVNPIKDLGFNGIIRATYPIVAPIAVGIGPWVFAVGVNKAMAAAGVAATGAAVAATGGAAAVGGAGKLAGKAGGAVNKLPSGKGSKITDAVNPSDSVSMPSGFNTDSDSYLKNKVAGAANKAGRTTKRASGVAKDASMQAVDNKDQLGSGLATATQKASRIGVPGAGVAGDVIEQQQDAKKKIRGKVDSAKKTASNEKTRRLLAEANSEDDGEKGAGVIERLEKDAIGKDLRDNHMDNILKEADGFKNGNKYENQIKKRRDAVEAMNQLYEEEDGEGDKVEERVGEGARQSFERTAQNIKMDDLMQVAPKDIQSRLQQKGTVVGEKAAEMTKTDGGMYWKRLKEHGLTDEEKINAEKAKEVTQNAWTDEENEYHDQMSIFRDNIDMNYDDARTQATSGNSVNSSDVKTSDLNELVRKIEQDDTDVSLEESKEVQQFLDENGMNFDDLDQETILKNDEAESAIRQGLNSLIEDTFNSALENSEEELSSQDLRNSDLQESDLMTNALEDAMQATDGEGNGFRSEEAGMEHVLDEFVSQFSKEKQDEIEEELENMDIDDSLSDTEVNMSDLNVDGLGENFSGSMAELISQTLESEVSSGPGGLVDMDRVRENIDSTFDENMMFGDKGREQISQHIADDLGDASNQLLDGLGDNVQEKLENGEIEADNVPDMLNDEDLARLQARRFAEKTDNIVERVADSGLADELENVDASDFDGTPGGFEEINAMDRAMDEKDPQEIVRKLKEA